MTMRGLGGQRSPSSPAPSGHGFTLEDNVAANFESTPGVGPVGRPISRSARA